MKIDLKLAEDKIMDGLKDFQRATVERVFELYKSGQSRVLVADEVGLGKTLIAKGVIVKTARYNYKNGDDLFKVVYICSNQSIANQNINKLKISDDITVDGVSDTRLSMQHLKIFEQEYDDDIKDRYVQLIPLTPATSFSMTSGCGSMEERALIFAILRRMSMFKEYFSEIEVILIDNASSSWNWAKDKYENRVAAGDEKTLGAYINSVTKLIESYIEEKNMFYELVTLCKKVRSNGCNKITGTRGIIYKLRMMFAQISVDLLNPDLVIMDEFQRFKFLINADDSSETGILSKRFLNGNGIKVLLLSATPYKLYSTLEEINETQNDEHYYEFIQVMNFLINNDKRQDEFKEVWNNLSVQLREIDFDYISIIEAKNKAEMLLWIPPSKPYYEPQGVFKYSKNFSKILVFSAWEMVPRMIASLISYEAERRTVGKLIAQNIDKFKNKDKQNTSYFAPNNKRYPPARLRFNVTDATPQSMSMFCLMYPSKKLAELYNPIDYINQGKTIQEIEKDLAEKISILLGKLDIYQNNSRMEDERWYNLAPLLLDNPGYVTTWFYYGDELISGSTEEEKDKGQKGFISHLTKLKEYYNNPYNAQLGKMPSDLAYVLAHIAIASPAVCEYRSNGQNSIYATQLSKIMINMFNKQESIAVVELCYGRGNKDAYWRNVLHYCRDGNLQAVLDEYVHMLTESNGINDADNKYKTVHSLMMDSMKTHTASYNIDTYSTFKDSILTKKDKSINMRSHYAVGFYKGEGDNSKIVNRKESVRSSFNSPFRPFVLATTSIGQEGLDFHFYCRKVVHWNLPSNPIDLEQREGRVNRFKCLAIRQNIALKYGDRIKFKKDIWNELFECAKEEYKTGYSELIPFWCLPDNQEVKIERIISSYPLSKDIGNYKRLIKILSLYRLTLGQARQEELLEYIFTNCKDSNKLKDLFINLSPFYRECQSYDLKAYEDIVALTREV